MKCQGNRTPGFGIYRPLCWIFFWALTCSNLVHGQASHDQWRSLHRTAKNTFVPRLLPKVETDRLQSAWWEPRVQKPIFKTEQALRITLSGLLVGALENSAQIAVYKDMPLIRETEIMEADAAFDWTPFVESYWNDVNEPVGNLLTTNQRRYLDRNTSTEFGIRRKNQMGGEFKVAQEFGHQFTNSQFFIPKNQGTARLTFSYTQPLLRGAGRVYNTGFTVLAQVHASAAHDEFSKSLQAHLVDVTRAYWELYLERGNLLQKNRLYQGAVHILETLESRQEIDVARSQILTARAVVQIRKTDIVRARTQVRNAENRIRFLVNDAKLGSAETTELIPGESPWRNDFPVDVPSSIHIALQNRPEIHQAIKQIKAAGLRLQLAKSELLPMLNLILKTYNSGLRGSSDVGGAWLESFEDGRPSYAVGVQYELPYGNRAAKARLQAKRTELRQLESQFRVTTEATKLDVEIAVRELKTSFAELHARYAAMMASESDVAYRTDRWRTVPGRDRVASYELQDLLDAQERLNDAELSYLEAELSYSLAQITYKRSIGTLLEAEQISVQRYCESHLPNLQLQRYAHPSSSAELPPPPGTTSSQSQFQRTHSAERLPRVKEP